VACAAGPSVNRTLTIELDCEKKILNIKLIFNEKFLKFHSLAST
jgi:hypothetical protein